MIQTSQDISLLSGVTVSVGINGACDVVRIRFEDDGDNSVNLYLVVDDSLKLANSIVTGLAGQAIAAVTEGADMNESHNQERGEN
jgi:hypothetical protein